MIWVPVVSILIFGLTLIPMIVVGMRIGWRSALFLAVLFLLFTILWLVLGLLTYKVLWWDIYKDLFVSKNVDANLHLNLDLFASYYKPTVLIIIATLFSPLSLGFTWLIYYKFKIPLNKYLGHKVEMVSSNQKQILVHKKRLSSKIGGGAILGVSALFTGSMLASTANVFLTPYYKSGTFNKFNDLIAKIYSFGLAGNTNDVQVLQSFLEKIDSEMVNGVGNLIAFHAASDDTNSLPLTNKLFYIRDNFKKFEDIFQYPAATKALFEVLFFESLDQINLLALNQEILTAKLDSNNNIIGLNKEAEKILLADYEAFLTNSNNSLARNNLPLILQNLIYDTLMQSIIAFEDSVFIQEINNLKSKQSNVNDLLKQRQAAKQTAINNANAKSGEIKNLTIRLEKLAGRNANPATSDLSDYDITKKDIRQIYQKISIGSKIESSNLTLTSGLIFDANENVKNKNNLLIQASTLVDDKKTIADNYYTNEVRVAENALSTAQSAEYDASQEYLRAQNNLTSLDSKINSYKDQLKTKEEKRKSQENIIAQKQEAIRNSTDENEKDQLNLEISQAQSAVDILTSEIGTIQGNINSSESQRPSLVTAKNEKKITYEEKQAATSEALVSKNQKTDHYSSLMDAYESALNAKNQAQINHNEALRNLQNLINEFNNGVENTLPSFKNELQNFESAYDKLEVKNTDLDIVTDQAQIAWANFTTENNDDESIYWAKKHQEFLNNKLKQLENIAQEKKKVYDEMHEKLQNNLKVWIFN